MIYFLFTPDSNLENYLNFLEFILKINQDRKKNKQKKIPIIFIGNYNIGKTEKDGLYKILKIMVY